MNEKEDDLKIGRRAALSKIMGGSTAVVVTKWIAPVVGVVTLPAHAETSSATISDAGKG
ncbi:MAG: hypothetical protein KAH77_09940 [Thiomargarita sp.]|nr:hypothetical protein [Thiomargarita sp.]